MADIGDWFMVFTSLALRGEAILWQSWDLRHRLQGQALRVGRRNLHTLGRGSILPPNLAFAAFASPCDCTKIVLTPN